MNVKNNYEKQILDHNDKKLSLIVRDNINLFSSTDIPTKANYNAILQVNFVGSAKKIRKELKQYIKKNKQIKLEYS